MGEIKAGGRKGGVMGMISTVWVRATVWAGEMQFDERTGGGMGMRSVVLDSRLR